MQMLPQKGDVLSIRNRRSIVEGIGSPRLLHWLFCSILIL
jgi:hypothetical protein